MSEFYEYVRNRLHRQNKNFLCAIVGPTGSGKSYCALRLAQKVDENFDISRVVFTPQEFMDLLNSGKLKRGSAIVFDEAGVAINSRNFQSQTNKLLNFINQTFRSNNFCVIYTMPDFNFIDLSVRKLVHCVLETKKIDYARQLVQVKPLMVENNPQNGRVYMKYPRYTVKNSRVSVAITRFLFEKPSPELVAAYEDRKVEFNKALQKDVQNSLAVKKTPLASTREKLHNEFKVILDTIMANKEKYLTPRGALNEGKVALEFGIGNTQIRRIRQYFSVTCVSPIDIHPINRNTTPHKKTEYYNDGPEAIG